MISPPCFLFASFLQLARFPSSIEGLKASMDCGCLLAACTSRSASSASAQAAAAAGR